MAAGLIIVFFHVWLPSSIFKACTIMHHNFPQSKRNLFCASLFCFFFFSSLRWPFCSPFAEGGKPHFERRFEILIKALVSFWMTSFFPLQWFKVDFTLWPIFAKVLVCRSFVPWLWVWGIVGIIVWTKFWFTTADIRLRLEANTTILIIVSEIRPECFSVWLKIFKNGLNVYPISKYHTILFRILSFVLFIQKKKCLRRSFVFTVMSLTAETILLITIDKPVQLSFFFFLLNQIYNSVCAYTILWLGQTLRLNLVFFFSLKTIESKKKE